MKPGARIQTAVELLEQIMLPPEGREAVPADTLLSGYFRGRRYIGSKDRRVISELVYTVLRNRARLDPAGGADRPHPRRQMIRALVGLLRWPADEVAATFDGSRYGPPPLSPEETVWLEPSTSSAPDEEPVQVRANVPDWLAEHYVQAFPNDLRAELNGLVALPPVDLRVNTLAASREEARAELAEAGIPSDVTPNSPWGLRLTGRTPINSLPAFREGRIEVQDEGSQLCALLTGAGPGESVLDYCAGAGGKSLALAAMMNNDGRILAADVDGARLRQLEKRAVRAGASMVQTQLLGEAGVVERFDRVVVDAPCSGSGAWRRHPEAPWRLTADRLTELCRLQSRILRAAARCVRPGGTLIYITCSVFVTENRARVDAFLNRHADFLLRNAAELWPGNAGAKSASALQDLSRDPRGLLLTPHRTGTDGFFCAHFKRAE